MSDPKGFLVMLSAPSGCGKTTLVTRLLQRHPEWFRSISVTTRPRRVGEKKGKDYEFVSLKEFEALRRKEGFLEWARIFNQYYGTKKAPIEEAVRQGKTVLLAIDIQGTRQIRKKLAQKVPLCSIFILPPSITVLRERLMERKTDSTEEIEKRIGRAEEEIKVAGEYDGTVVNLDLNETVKQIEKKISEFQKGKGGK